MDLDLLKSSLPEWESNVCDDNSEDDIEEPSTSERQHDKLLEAIASLSGQKRSLKKQRNEPVVKASEFHTSTGDAKVKLSDLVGALQSGSGHADLKKKLNKVQKQQKVLATPLPKHEQEKIERTVAYENTCKDLRKWDPVVQKNRKNEQAEFPLQQPDLRLVTSDQFVKRFQPTTQLEKEVAALLHGSENVLKPGAVLTPAEEKALRAMSIEEAKERRAELQKHRALLSYREKKARRQKKIKSKKFHKIMRKEKIKQEKRTLDELEKTDPEAYVEKLQHLERQRIQERMSLKHRGGSKYMKKQALYSKYDDNARQAIQEMIRKNKELTQKVIVSDEEEELVSEIDEQDADNISDKIAKNPWMSTAIKKKQVKLTIPKEIVNNDISSNSNLEIQAISGESSNVAHSDSENSDLERNEDNQKLIAEQFQNIDDIFNEVEKKKQKEKKLNKSKTRKLNKKLKMQEELQVRKNIEKQKQRKQNKKEESSESESESGFSDSEDEKLEKTTKEGELVNEQMNQESLSVSLKRKNKLEDFEGDWSDDGDQTGKTITYRPDIDSFTRNKKQSHQEQDMSSSGKDSTKEISLDPSKFFTVDSSSLQQDEDGLVVSESDNKTKEDEQRMTIAQAFASDDVIEEFVVEKKSIEERDKPKDIDLTLPGWGEWGGSGVQASKKKRKKFLIKASSSAPRKDKNLTNVIISETKDKSISKHQVNQLPFPFSSVHDFQKSIRQPIGKTWNPETSYKDMIRPKITTKMGTIIDPIDKSEVFKNVNKRKSNTDMDFSSKCDDQKSNVLKQKVRKKSH